VDYRPSDAPATGDPLGSVTVPVIDAVTSWPQTFVPAASVSATAGNAYSIFPHNLVTIFVTSSDAAITEASPLAAF